MKEYYPELGPGETMAIVVFVDVIFSRVRSRLFISVAISRDGG
jgi:hypothetical protein